MKKKPSESIRVTIDGELLKRLRAEEQRLAFPEGLASLARVRLSEALPPVSGERRP